MPVKQSNGSDYGLGSCLVPSPSLGNYIYGMFGGRCSAGVRLPLFVHKDLHIGMASGTLEGSPNLYNFGQWNGQNSHAWGRHSPNEWLQGPLPGGCVAQDFEDRSLKTQTQLKHGDVGMAGPIYKP